MRIWLYREMVPPNSSMSFKILILFFANKTIYIFRGFFSLPKTRVRDEM